MNADKALELARLTYPNDENLRVAYMLGLTAGANWQKAQDLAKMAQSESPLSVAYVNRCFENGKQAMREQMLKDVVEVTVENWNPDPHPEVTIPLNPDEFIAGDKVRIVVLKEEEE